MFPRHSSIAQIPCRAVCELLGTQLTLALQTLQVIAQRQHPQQAPEAEHLGSGCWIPRWSLKPGLQDTGEMADDIFMLCFCTAPSCPQRGCMVSRPEELCLNGLSGNVFLNEDFQIHTRPLALQLVLCIFWSKQTNKEKSQGHFLYRVSI